MDVPEVFRSLNERIANASHNGGLELVCECGNELCTERFVIATDEFESIRVQPRRFLVRPGHENGARIVDGDDRFLVVE